MKKLMSFVLVVLLGLVMDPLTASSGGTRWGLSAIPRTLKR
jgi:hypothetical protein